MGETPAIVLDDRFELRREVGMGAMGIVYEAWDRHAFRSVAVKVLRSRAGGGAQRFVREGATLAELDHPGIVRYVTHGTSPEGETFLVMEWLEGLTLEKRLLEGPLDVSETLALARRVADALSAAHWRGVVHRDLKPSNLFLPGGVSADAKILDFGIAWRLWDEHRLTQSGAVLGTPLYMSPEQARGEQRIDERSDIYSLGAVLFECLTGEPPFPGTTAMAILCKICLEDPPRVAKLAPDVTPALDALIRSMLAKDPASRPENALTLASALASISIGGANPQISVSPRVAITEGEQRVLCVIFLREPSIAPSISVNEVTLTLAPAHAEQQDAIADASAPHGGRLHRLVDGSIVITFPADVSPTDQAADVARCARSVRDLLPDSAVVICTGRGTILGRTPLGEVIERGVTLMRDTRLRSIRLDTTTAGLLGASFEIDGSENALYLGAEREPGAVSRTLLGKVVPCVGREPELRLLEGIFSDMVDDQESRAVLVTASAGSGKSRLVHELIRRLRQSKQFELVLGRAESMRAGSPFGLLAPAIRWAAGISVHDSPEARRQKLLTRISRHKHDDGARRVAEFLGEMAGLPFPGNEASAVLRTARQDARLMGDHVRAAWIDWLEAECSAQPVLLVLEDLHWSDPSSVQLVDAALRVLSAKAIFVLALGRPEVTTRFPRLWEERGLKTFPLSPLARRACEKLAIEVLGQVDATQVVRRIVDQADGNPLVLEELLRAAADGNRQFPETILGMLQARLDALGSGAGRVLRAASIFGQTFTREGVRSLLGSVDELDVEGCLLSLVEKEVIQRGGTGASDYTFRHALVREACHARLTEGDRVLGHRLAGDWLEAAGETDAMVMADHFDLGGDRARAAGWYARAAAQALQADDPDAAIARAQRATTCGAQGATLSRIHLIEAQAHYRKGGLSPAVACGKRAIEHAAVGSSGWFDAIRELTMPMIDLGRGVETVSDLAERAVAATPDSPEAVDAKIACLSWCGGALTLGRENDLAGRLLGRAESMLAAQARREPWVSARFHYANGIRKASMGDTLAAIEELEAAYEAAEQAGDVWTACGVRGEIGLTWADLGEPERAEKFVRQVLLEARRRGLSAVEGFTLPDLGYVLILQGRVEEAKNALAQAIVIANEQGNVWSRGLANIYLARTLLVAGDCAGSEACARAAASDTASSPDWQAVALGSQARALLTLGQVPAAWNVAEQAKAILDERGSIKGCESLVRLTIAEICIALGDESKAREALRAAHHRLMQRADRITDRHVRANFLARIPENVRTLELAAAWGISPAARENALTLG